ncbi:putative ribonuclease h protein [Quercus suber]|uniref:Ribonuclease h protein n=1 Tax=Quercus suber TaxID=58331 RepID=A0AAW0JQX1_QUESU
MFNEVLDKVISRSQSWNAKILSQASRITLVKSVLASIPTYTSSTFDLSKNICSKIDVLRNLLGKLYFHIIENFSGIMDMINKKDYNNVKAIFVRWFMTSFSTI